MYFTDISLGKDYSHNKSHTYNFCVIIVCFLKILWVCGYKTKVPFGPIFVKAMSATMMQTVGEETE